MLNELNYDQRVFKTPGYDIYANLTVPFLKSAKHYLRGVGYFTSQWLKYNCDGIADIAEKGGTIKFVTSPILSKTDLEAFRLADRVKQEEWLFKKLASEMTDIQFSLETNTRNTLAWLVADGILEFRFAVPLNKRGMYHEKIGVFTDDNKDKVVMHGSNNDTENALFNGESLSIYRSWVEGEDYYANEHNKLLEQIFHKSNPNFRIYDMPEIVKKRWVHMTNGTMRPYELPFEQQKDKDNNKKIPKEPRIPSYINLYEYQKDAISKWWANNQRGIYRLATGTGKSYTGLATSVRIFNEKGRVFTIISVPFKHLIHQWEKDCAIFGYTSVQCYSKNAKWYKEANDTINRYNAGLIKHACLIVTHLSNADENKFLKLISRIKHKEGLFYIADEVHYLGSEHLQKNLHPDIHMRLGLSATPERWQDQDGTSLLYDYFDKDVINLDLKEAIDNKFLTKYDYHTVVVRLTPAEQSEYIHLTRKIRKFSFLKEKSGDDKSLKTVLQERARLIQNSRNKLSVFYDVIQSHIDEVGVENFRWTLVYSPEGENHHEIKQSLQQMGLSVASVINETKDSERERIIKEFEEGKIQVIVAMKCLDEGVNVPSAMRGYFLASTSNPRQFIQRRGRLLRLPKAGRVKEKAVIYDFVMLPFFEEHTKDDCQSLIKREMARFVEFTSASINDFSEKKKLENLLTPFGMGHLPFMKFEDFYAELEGELETDED